MKKQNFFTAKNIALLGILVALTVVLQLTASAIPMFGVTMNFSLIPIVLAAIFLGWIGGGLVGFVSGMITFITCAIMGQEPFTFAMFQASPFVLTVMCIGKTTVAGIVSGLIFPLASRFNSHAASFFASAIVPIVNTGLYLVGLILMKNDVFAFFGMTETATAWGVLTLAMSIIWLNFVLEIAVNIVFVPAIHAVVRVFGKKNSK